MSNIVHSPEEEHPCEAKGIFSSLFSTKVSTSSLPSTFSAYSGYSSFSSSSDKEGRVLKDLNTSTGSNYSATVIMPEYKNKSPSPPPSDMSLNLDIVPHSNKWTTHKPFERNSQCSLSSLDTWVIAKGITASPTIKKDVAPLPQSPQLKAKSLVHIPLTSSFYDSKSVQESNGGDKLVFSSTVKSSDSAWQISPPSPSTSFPSLPSTDLPIPPPLPPSFLPSSSHSFLPSSSSSLSLLPPSVSSSFSTLLFPPSSTLSPPSLLPLSSPTSSSSSPLYSACIAPNLLLDDDTLLPSPSPQESCSCLCTCSHVCPAASLTVPLPDVCFADTFANSNVDLVADTNTDVGGGMTNVSGGMRESTDSGVSTGELV